MVRKRTVLVGGVVSTLLVGAGLGVARAEDQGPRAQHVLYISVDGMHESDLQWYVKNNPSSTLAKLDGNGVEFTNAQTSNPSDSYPGIVAPFTGGGPQSTGVYYDDVWNHGVFPPGTTSCTGSPPGAEALQNEVEDKDQTRLDAGQGIANELGGTAPNYNILQLNSNADTLIDPKHLVVDPASCQPIYPHNYIQVNSVFNIAHNAGLFTAWSDKHPANEILDGPSGLGVNDYFSPEINSDSPLGGDWTADNQATMNYDNFKVQAVVNWINGEFHNGTPNPQGTPAIFGMNFQTVSTAEKLPKSDGLVGGYTMSGGQLVPGALLTRAFDYINTSLTTFVNALHARGLDKSTVIIVSAKHGQSPMNPAELVRIPDGPIIAKINADWASTHPGATLVVQGTDDDAMLLWLSDRSPAATSFVKSELENYSGTNGNRTASDGVTPITGIDYDHAGLQQIFAGADAANYFHVQPGDQRVPDVFGIAHYGVVYTGGMKKIAEHGGAHFDDLNVPLLVSGTPIGHGDRVDDTVHTTQIAPTILNLLGLDPKFLQAVQIEHTQALDLSGG